MNDTSTMPPPDSPNVPDSPDPAAGETPRPRPSRFPPVARWTVVFIIVMIALVVAIWPRDRGSDAPAVDPATSGVRATDAPIDDAALAQARREAAIADCPDLAGTPGPHAVLAGVSAPCLATGAPTDLGIATAGRPMVINIWAVWCEQCRRELPYLQDFSRRAGDRVTVLGVHAQTGAGNPVLVLKYLTEIGVHLPVVLDTNGQVSRALDAPPLFPCTILLRADGTVAKVLPKLFRSADDFAEVVDEYLGVRV